MAETAESEELHWFSPPLRAILPLETFHCPQSLAKTVRQKKFDMRFDSPPRNMDQRHHPRRILPVAPHGQRSFG